MIKIYKKTRKKVLVWLVAISSALILMLAVYINSNNMEERVNVNKSEFGNEPNISIERIYSILNENMKDRCVLKANTSVLIGENSKQLENGFYDIKFELKSKSLIVYVNKLWKVFNEELYEEEYINEVMIALQKIIDVSDDLNELRTCLKSEYIKTKKNEEIQNKNTFEISNFIFNIRNANKEVVITINY